MEEFVAVLCKDLGVEHQPKEIERAFQLFAKNAPPGLIRVSDLENALKVHLRGKSGQEIYTLMKQFEVLITCIRLTSESTCF